MDGKEKGLANITVGLGGACAMPQQKGLVCGAECKPSAIDITHPNDVVDLNLIGIK